MDFDPALMILKAVVVLCVAPTAVVFHLQARNATRWAPAPRAGGDGDGGYRHGTLEELARRAGPAPRATPPLLLVLTAWLSFGLGQMALPGLAAAIVGLFVLPPLGLVAIPGLVLAVAQFGPAAALYRREPGAPARLRWVANYTVLLNLVVVLVSVGAVAVGGREGVVIGVVSLPYASLSFVHAWLLRRAARVLEASLASEAAEEAASLASALAP